MQRTSPLALVIGLTASLFCAVTQQAVAKPNILIIVGDDMGYADVGCYGCKDIPTPHIDALAKGGVRCTSGYVSGPYCSPTRAGLMTGRYQNRFGHEFNPGPSPESEVGLPLTKTTLADRLKAAGYVTGMVGKWHLGQERKFHPISRGFQEFFYESRWLGKRRWEHSRNCVCPVFYPSIGQWPEPKWVVFEAVKVAPSNDERLPRTPSSAPSPHGPQFLEISVFSLSKVDKALHS
jgi:arylsulfatase A-like enzyme